MSSSIRPAAKKSLGQNFLVDRRIVGRILGAAEVNPDDTVVEIGPGRGTLTRALADRVGRLVAVEIDENLAASLAESFRDIPHVDILPADARHVDIESLVEPAAPYKVVANLPYYAATPIIRRFLEARHKPTVMVVMVQQEVARQMAAATGRMRLLSVAIQLYGRPHIVANVPPRAFRPAPKVTSSVLRIDVYPEPALTLDSQQEFFRLVRAGFSAPRKQLRNCLRQALGLPSDEVERMLRHARIDPERRPQTIALTEWGQLYEAYRASSAAPSGRSS